jgi:hypothetical protein
MPTSRLVWVFAALFLLCGLPLLVVEQVSWVRPLASLCMAFLGAFSLALAADAIRTGQLRVQGSVILYSRQPRLFWAALAVIALAGIGVLIGAVWAAFFKAW